MNCFQVILACAGLLVLLPGAKADLATATSGSYAASVDGQYVYVGPMNATVTGQQTNGEIWCDDYGHESYLNQPFQVFVSTIPSLTHARFAADGVRKYQEAAWLMLQYPTLTPKNNDTVRDLQVAIWHIFYPDLSLTTPGEQTWFNTAEALTNLDTYDFSSVLILTPVPSNLCNPQNSTCKPQYQEFLTTDPPVPEPATVFTLATGLVIAGFIVRHRQAIRV